MKKLTKPTKIVYFSIFILFLLSVALFIIILNIEVEKTIKINFIVDKNKKMILVAPEKSLFYLEKNKEVSISYLNKIYLLKISNFTKINETVIVNFHKIPAGIKLVSNTQVSGVLFYDKVKLWSLIWNI
ncbi:hypothetical protein MCAL160_0077 [Mycoplasmopsis californica HAZ160_1]|uniref:Uncharacterized protein n=2 Tax=Mycoplasmopsis californica TaxID=2113 RepID=A0A059XRS0_9BACT|nr:hypothetical protein [Mycoplasmopsis californica]AIA29725.1 hypothetical protein MCFN_03050 [Mycoplasmopsis californica]BAP00820.1 hypothetical protein MCAL160_0077 [Mycoplasmopsis californica HAZ160_1]BBG40675.1 hypothetical protein MCAL106_0077 [Mycoplasmopsis californica]BBG41270.1 hypothetical protein MCAL106E_0077 [Mycoplasmopsis californica]BBG41863.1 hypothetical protein MCAL106L_0077 [Mycoplasmopsis californica]